MAWEKKVHSYTFDGQSEFGLTEKQMISRRDLLVSFSTIKGVENAPALNWWLQNQFILASEKIERKEGEDDNSYIRRVRADQWRNGGGAAKLGSEVHDAIEKVFSGEKKVEDLDVELRKYVVPAKRYFDEKEFDILALEEVVVNLKTPYGGTMDLAAKSKDGKLFTLDFKTTSRMTGLPYSGQPNQVACYAAAYFGEGRVENEEIWGANLYLSTKETDAEGNAKSKVIGYTPEEMAEHWRIFKIMLDLYKARSGYDPILP